MPHLTSYCNENEKAGPGAGPAFPFRRRRNECTPILLSFLFLRYPPLLASSSQLPDLSFEFSTPAAPPRGIAQVPELPATRHQPP